MDILMPVRKGGLGNQLFQVASAHVYAKESGRTLWIPKQEQSNTHNTFQLDYTVLFREFGTLVEKNTLQDSIRHPGEPTFEPWTPLDVSGSVYLDGYFQWYPPLQRHEDEIREKVLKGLGNPEICLTRVGLHVRRGDYLHACFRNIFPVQPLEYYKKALAKMVLKGEVYVFSDDIEWCRSQDLFDDLPGVVFVQEPNEIRALALMATCGGGMICANSTFSWWGAFLGAHAVRNPVVVPKNWIRGFCVEELFPKEWFVL
jgi:hypothetical protein